MKSFLCPATVPAALLCRQELQVQFTPTINPATTQPANAGMHSTTRRAVVFNAPNTILLSLTWSTPIVCQCKESMKIVVFESNFGKPAGKTNDSACVCDNLFYGDFGRVSYTWNSLYCLTITTDSAVIAMQVTGVNYAVTDTNSGGCTSSLHADCNVFPEAILNLPDSVVLYPGDSALLVAQGGGSSFTWFPGTDLSATYISNPVAIPTADTCYFVQPLSEACCTVRNCVDMLLHSAPAVAFPNAFARGSGLRSRLKIIGQGIASLNYLRIFNRWGNAVLGAKNIGKGWNSTFNGAEPTKGVYIYQPNAVTPASRYFTQQGNLILIPITLLPLH